MLMLRQGLQALDITMEESEKGQSELRDRIEESYRTLREVRGSTEAQALAVKENSSMLRKLFWLVSRDMTTPLRALSKAVANVW